MAYKYCMLPCGPHLLAASPGPQLALTTLLPAIPVHLPHGLGIPPNTLAPTGPISTITDLGRGFLPAHTTPDPGALRRLPGLDPCRHLQPEAHPEWAAVGTCSVPWAGQLCPVGHSQHALQLG